MAAPIESETCAACLRQVPWLYLDVCEVCIPWGEDAKQTYREQHGVLKYRTVDNPREAGEMLRAVYDWYESVFPDHPDKAETLELVALAIVRIDK